MQEQLDPAVRRAREVVGLYGDPTVTWGISLDLTLEHPVDPDAVRAAARAMVLDHPHLGRAPDVRVVAEATWHEQLSRVTTDVYGDADPLVRLAVGEGGRRLAVGAHHGACDGLGLLAVAGLVTGRALGTSARGIGDRATRRSFLLSSAARVAEALVSPPARFRGTSRPALGESLARRDLPPTGSGTAGVAHAITQVLRARRAGGAVAGRRPVLSYGASRRAAGVVEPDRQTAYFRLGVDPSWTRDRLAARMAEIEPEPTFPETTAGGIGPRVTNVLRSRLGATAIISNLGLLTGGVVSAAMYPAANGPRSAAFGFATGSGASTLTLRTRRADFTSAEAEELLDEVAHRLRSTGEPAQYGS